MGSGEGKLSGRAPQMPALVPARSVYAPETAGATHPSRHEEIRDTQGGLLASLSSESPADGPLVPPGEGGTCERAFSFSGLRAEETSEEDVSVSLDEDEEVSDDLTSARDSPDVAAGLPGLLHSERLGGLLLRYVTLAREAFVYCSVMARVLRRKVTRLAPLRRLRWVYGVLATKLQGWQWPPPTDVAQRRVVASLQKKQL